MFLHRISSTDPRFRPLHFKPGLNILVADRTATSNQGDSRNSVGKTSFLRILKYLLGGNLPKELKAPELANHAFLGTFSFPREDGEDVLVEVDRPVRGGTRLGITGVKSLSSVDTHLDEWNNHLATTLFGIPPEVARPTVGQLWGQLIRTYFDNPVKGHASEADWESGVKLGFFLGLPPEVLEPAGAIRKLESQNKALRAAVKEGALAHLSLDEAGLRATLAAARSRRDRVRSQLEDFQVDEQYSSHQRLADDLTRRIRDLNEQLLIIQRRSRELQEAILGEQPEDASSEARIAALYAEIGLALPDAVLRRYEDVQGFHASVVRNRRVFLEDELVATESQAASLEAARRELDRDRAETLAILRERVALDTFMAGQRDLAALEADVADLERRLDAAASLSSIGDTVKLRTAELVANVRTVVQDHSDELEAAISLFSDLGSEIYRDREASLLVAPTSRGTLRVEPRLSGDAGGGVKSVETFMLDMICAVSAVRIHRAPPILVHDSHLFDAIDGRQVASCLNIGARLAEQFGFQYIVTMNSDFLENVKVQSSGSFNPELYELETRLTDASEEGGLFGFRFD